MKEYFRILLHYYYVYFPVEKFKTRDKLMKYLNKKRLFFKGDPEKDCAIEKLECYEIKSINDLIKTTNFISFICPYCGEEHKLTSTLTEFKEIIEQFHYNNVCFFTCIECKKVIHILELPNDTNVSRKKYYKVLLNGYDEYYSCDEFHNKASLLEYFNDNEIINESKPIQEKDIEEIEHSEIQETDAYTENEAILYVGCSKCNKSFAFSNNYDDEHNDIISEYEENQRAMFECPECGQLHIITDIEEDPFRR